uniref:Sema domain-containing protein n=1 Tax=Periophthalmus magnuspinnatus TaxID=409849 RepID=A0A3B3ZEX9_9GOBI
MSASGLYPSLLLLLWSLLSSASSQCDHSSENSKINLNVDYKLPTFTSEFPIQNMVTLDGIIYVGATNRIYALSPNLTKLSEYSTGPLRANETCRLQTHNPNTKLDNRNIALVTENIYDKGLYSCGSADNGICRRHVLYEDDEIGPKMVDDEVYCFTDRARLRKGVDSDVVVSASGSQVLNVESNLIKFFVGNSEIPGNTATPNTHTISVRKMKTSQNGFTFFSSGAHMDLLASLRGNYYLRYVYSFNSGPFTYFLTVQHVSKDSTAFHTRIIRMCATDSVIRRYVEMPLQCISTDKRRKRSTEDVKVFNILQGAYVSKIKEDTELQKQLKVGPNDDVLFAAFAKGKPDSPEATSDSAVCVFSLNHINNMIRRYMQSYECDPHEGMHEGRESTYRLQITQFLPRLEYWHQDLSHTLLTSITVATVHARTVAYLGTSDGRHLQVRVILFSRSSSPHVNIALDSAPVSSSLLLQDQGRLLVATGNKITSVPLIGPGCDQLTTCTSCLLSSRVTECGWCNGRCTRSSQCSSAEWSQEYCAPVITKFWPISAPLRGSTSLTICGHNFGFDKTERLNQDQTKSTSVLNVS